MKFLFCLFFINFFQFANPLLAGQEHHPLKYQLSEDQSSGEIVRQLLLDYRKFTLKTKKQATGKDPAWWAVQNQKWAELERRRTDLKEVLSDTHKKKLKRWAEQYENLSKRSV